MSTKVEKDVIVLSALEEDLLTVLIGRTEGVYGLEILEQVNAARRNLKMRTLSIGSLYPTLKRMEKAGLVSEEFRESVSGKGSARRKYYKISASGEISLTRTQAYRRQLSQKDREISGLLPDSN